MYSSCSGVCCQCELKSEDETRLKPTTQETFSSTSQATLIASTIHKASKPQPLYMAAQTSSRGSGRAKDNQLRHRMFRLRHWAVLQAIVVVLFVPWVAVLIQQISRHIATGSSLAAPTIADFIYTFSSYSGTLLLLVLFLALSVLSLFGYQKIRGSMDWKAPLKALEGYAWE